MSRVSVVGAALLLLGAAHASAEDKLFMWKVTSGTGEVYLLGSMHMAPDDLYPLPRDIESAFKSSHTLAVEADVTNPEQAGAIQGLVLEKGMYSEGESLSKNLKAETLDALKATCEKMSLPFESMDRMKPWLVGIQLQALGAQRSGLNPQKGIDPHFLEKARKKAKKILELESVRLQLDILAGFPDELQEKGLLMTLKELDKVEEKMKTMVEVWKAGDAERMEAFVFEDRKKHPELKDVYDKMLDERNMNMLTKIEGYLKEKGPFFVVVGAAHLVGEKGLVKLLEGKKYKVVQQKKGSVAEKKPEKEPAGSGAK